MLHRQEDPRFYAPIALGLAFALLPTAVLANAKPTDPSAEIYYVETFAEGGDFYLYITEGRGFRIGCGATRWFLDLLEGLGVPIDPRVIPPIMETHPKVVEASPHEQPQLECEADTVLYRVYGDDFSPTDAYLLNYPNQQNGLYAATFVDIGCEELFLALGLSKLDARPLTQSAIDAPFTKIASLNCAVGTPITGFSCGDGVKQSGEECDDGDTVDTGNGCDRDCARNDVCGNAVTEALFEGCDDGNQVDEDGCSASCKADDGGACTLDLHCVSGHCAHGFGAPTSACAPEGHCATSGLFFSLGYRLCSEDTHYRICGGDGAWGQWGKAWTNPDPADDFCQPGGVPQGGYDLAASCESGVDGGFRDPGCHSCRPLRAQNASSCFGDCGPNDDAKCWPGYHCDGRDNACYPNTPGNPCDDAGDCATLRCADVCLPGLNNGQTCHADPNCKSQNCSEDYAFAAHYCANTGSCAYGSTAIPVGHALCGPDGRYLRYCVDEGHWGETSFSPDPVGKVCAVDGVPDGGYDPPASCHNGPSGGFQDTEGSCLSCAPFRANNQGECFTSCARDDDAKCWPDYHCSRLTGGCHSSENGQPCDIDGECASGRCEESCQAKLSNGHRCDERSDCRSGNCQSGACCTAGRTCCLTHADCGRCKKCASNNTCVLQSSAEDVKGECSDGPCRTGMCNGNGTCGFAPQHTDCGVCRSCDTVGQCRPNSSDHSDCAPAYVCRHGECRRRNTPERHH